jgi:hypothetical protein
VLILLGFLFFIFLRFVHLSDGKTVYLELDC